MEEQFTSIPHLREEVRNDTQAAPLTTDGQDSQSASPTPSSPLDLRRLSLSSDSSWCTEILGDDLLESDNSPAPQPPLPSDISHELPHTETDGPWSDVVLVHKPAKNECRGPNQAQADQEDAKDGKKEDGRSEDKRITDLPESAVPSAAKSEPDESTPISQLPVRHRIDIFFPCALVVDQCKTDSSPTVLFCIDRIVDDGDGQVFVVREPCHGRPCHHSFVQGLKTAKIPVRHPNRRTYVITRVRESSEADHREVMPDEGGYLTIKPKCSVACRHTAVEVDGPKSTACILPTCFEATVVPPPKLLMPDRHSAPLPSFPLAHNYLSGSTQTGDDSIDRCRSWKAKVIKDIINLHNLPGAESGSSGQSNNLQQKGQGVSRLGPFSAVPCVFCGKDATRPQLESPTTSMGTTLDTSESYGYRCSLCGGKNWLTGLQWSRD